MSDRLTKHQINMEVKAYRQMYREEVARLQATDKSFVEVPFGNGFAWGHITIETNAMTGTTKTFKTLLCSMCSSDIYGLAEAAADRFSNIEFSHINMD